MEVFVISETLSFAELSGLKIVNFHVTVQNQISISQIEIPVKIEKVESIGNNGYLYFFGRLIKGANDKKMVEGFITPETEETASDYGRLLIHA
ncbi:hypothetical protein B6D52_02345 [Candidatus Parcubacteria bacterium 4484_255]|nr:MAG: hypothetical protein B6D52_02345 [Candidatus Parcubacteria bacterium 4484_255]